MAKNRPVFIFQASLVFCSYIINIIIILTTFILSRLFPDPSCGSLQSLLPLLIDFYSDSCCLVLLLIIHIALPDLCFMLTYLSHRISLLFLYILSLVIDFIYVPVIYCLIQYLFRPKFVFSHIYCCMKTLKPSNCNGFSRLRSIFRFKRFLEIKGIIYPPISSVLHDLGFFSI